MSEKVLGKTTGQLPPTPKATDPNALARHGAKKTLAAEEEQRLVDKAWEKKPRKANSAGPLESISPRWVEGSQFKTERVTTIPGAKYWGRTTRNGQFFGIQVSMSEFQVIDLKSPEKRRVSLTQTDDPERLQTVDPAFTPFHFVTGHTAMPLERLYELSKRSYPLDEVTQKRAAYGGYAEPNSRIVVFNRAMAIDTGGYNPADYLSASNTLLLAHWDDKRGENVPGPVFSVPGEWDFSVASDEPTIIGRFGPVSENGPGSKSYDQTGYVIYDVEPNSLKIVPRLKVKTLSGGKAKLMDNLLAIAHAVEETDFKLYGFDSSKDPKFQRLLEEGSADIFVYDLVNKTHSRITNSGPGKYAWSPSFFRDEKGQPALTYLFREGGEKNDVGKFSVHRATLKQPLREAALDEPIVDKVWTGPEFGERFSAAHRQYLAAAGSALKAQHHAMHHNRKTTPGFLLEHRSMMRDFELWLAKSEFADLLVDNRGERTLPAWRPNTPIPKGISTGGFLNTNPRLRTPDWVGATEGTLSDPVFKRKKLEDFVTPYELGKSLITGNTFGTGYHGAAHELLGGKMASDAPQESPIFWLLHRHFDDILMTWLRTPNGGAWLKTQEGMAWAKTAQLPADLGSSK